MEGFGRLEKADGTTYVGDFKASRYHGSGRLETAGLTYEGPFEQGHFHGVSRLKTIYGRKTWARFEQGKTVKQTPLPFTQKKE
jgi:hypothetical protein